MHFDDGTREKIALPDADGTVVLGDEVVERCACERCACAEPLGRALPLPDEQKGDPSRGAGDGSVRRASKPA